MTSQRVVPLFGLAFVLFAATMLVTIIVRSPYTHANLLNMVPADYDRTGVDAIREVNLGVIRAELAELPPSAYSVANQTPPRDPNIGAPLAGVRLARSSPATASSPEALSALGKELFTQKCTSCHTIGGGRRVGPDLRNITKQNSKEWLVAFITTPDQLIARGDPMATSLVNAFGLPMPNLDISPVQAEAILAYLEAKSEVGTESLVATVSRTGEAPGSGMSPAPASQSAKPGASEGKALFEQKCASCHTIGGGNLVGPDLKGVTTQRPRDWLVQFITVPDKLIGSGDETAAQLLKEFGMPMPNLGVSASQAEQLLAYLGQQSGSGQGNPQSAPSGAAAVAGAAAAPGNAVTGRLLFTGEQRLANGGPSCMSCHNAAGTGGLGGGSWGLDLTEAQARTGAAGIAAILKSPPFPGMKEAFADHQITDGEIADLSAFMATSTSQQGSVSNELTFLAVGVIGLAALIVVAQLVWRSRSGGVRRQLVILASRRRPMA